jgi:hypothetical protein
MPAKHILAHLPFPWNSPAALRQTRNQSAEDLATPCCPVCGHPLILRQDRQGPYFFCRCIRTLTTRPRRVIVSGKIDDPRRNSTHERSGSDPST